jgi:hypothetical protein
MQHEPMSPADNLDFQHDYSPPRVLCDLRAPLYGLPFGRRIRGAHLPHDLRAHRRTHRAETFGYSFSVAIWVGYIALFGIAVETGVVMLI